LIAAYFPSLKIFGFFKITRILRLDVLVSRSNYTEQIKTSLNLMKLTFYLCVYIHVMGCLWW